MHKRAIPLDDFGDIPLSGEVDGVAWELAIEELARPFRSPHRALRRLTPSGIETWPALKVSGRVSGLHSERGSLRGPGVELSDVAVELGHA